jgi:NADH dehydrogenase/NADH:ubiquinone oxidoreductase subunit G
MGMVNITINDQKYSVPAGSTVLQAAQQVGVDIPTLCHHPALAPIGACRICLVEIKGQRVLQPACTFPISEGLEIQTESPQVVKVRKFVLDLLFSERNHYCMYCEISGDCELQTLGYRYGLDHWVYPTYTKRFPVDATRETFLMDHNRCVLCRRCVRACSELVANHTLGMRQRGASSMIHADLDVPFGESSCISCGTCLQVCPTGALIDKRSAFMGRDVQAEHVASTCSQCSVGCGIKIVTRGGSVLRVEGDWDAAVNGGLLCQKGRFAPLYDKRQRVTTPLVRRSPNGALEAASWDEALQMVAGQLASAARAGGSKLGVLASTQATNEALYLLSQLFRQELKAAHVGLLSGAVPRLAKPLGSLRDIAGSDVILVVGADPVTDQPVAAFAIKRAVDGGARLIVVDGTDAPAGWENPLAPLAHICLGMSELDQALDMAARAEHAAVVYGAGLTAEAARALETLPQATFVGLEPGVNTRAAVALGLNAAYDPSNAEVTYILAGEEAWDGREAGQGFVAVQASYVSPLTERADVVLPMAIWSERAGSLTDLEGHVQKASQAVKPAGEAKPDWEILSLLASTMGKKLPGSFDEISDRAVQALG